jgi:hypothetical protein
MGMMLVSLRIASMFRQRTTPGGRNVSQASSGLH